MIQVGRELSAEGMTSIKFMLGYAVAFALGAGCRYFDLPAPAPPTLAGALLVVAVTLGYWAAGAFLS